MTEHRPYCEKHTARQSKPSRSKRKAGLKVAPLQDGGNSSQMKRFPVKSYKASFELQLKTGSYCCELPFNDPAEDEEEAEETSLDGCWLELWQSSVTKELFFLHFNLSLGGASPKALKLIPNQ